jgi:glycosyltransferase involved in cell wall biosynthesis
VRVLILISEAPPIASGVARCAEHLVGGLKALGHEVDVVSSADIKRWSFGEVRISSFIAHWPTLARRIPEYDVINVHGPVPTMSDLLLSLIGRIPPLRRPAIVYTHHSSIDLPRLRTMCHLYERMHRNLAFRSDRVLVTTPSYEQLLAAPDDVPVEVLPWGVDHDRFLGPREARSPGAPLRVLFLGQLRPYKGVTQLIEAARGQPDLMVTIAGSGPMANAYRARAAAIGASNVSFVGHVADELLPELYNGHDVIVLPSTTRAEAFGLTLLEGMAAGCVPVASDLPGVRDVAGPTGLLVPPEDPLALRETLLGLHRDREFLASLAQASRLRASAMPWAHVAPGYERAFRAAIATARRRQAAVAFSRQWLPPEQTLDTVRDHFRASWGSLVLFERAPQPIPRASWGRFLIEHLRASAPRIAQYVARTRTPLLLDHRATSPVRSLLIREDVSSGMSVPVRTARGTLGVLNLSMAPHEGRSFSQHDLEHLVQLVAS